jgi:phosphoglycolate phosphatase
MRYRLLLWDFDGTLADSLMFGLELYNRLAASLGCRPIQDPQQLRHLSTRQVLRHCGISLWRLPRLVRRFHAAAAAGAAQIRLYPLLEELLPLLQAAGVRMGIVSSNSEANIRQTLRANAAESYFEFVASCPRLFRKGRVVRHCIRRLGVPREQVLYIGDEVRDIVAARQARIAVAAVTWGFHVAEALRAAQPDYLLTHPRQLVTVVGLPWPEDSLTQVEPSSPADRPVLPVSACS